MGFAKNVYNVICHCPHLFCLKCTKKCVQNRWTSKEGMEMSMAEPSVPAPTVTNDETVSI